MLTQHNNMLTSTWITSVWISDQVNKESLLRTNDYDIFYVGIYFSKIINFWWSSNKNHNLNANYNWINEINNF